VVVTAVHLEEVGESMEGDQADPETPGGRRAVVLGGQPRAGESVNVSQLNRSPIVGDEQLIALKEEPHRRRLDVVGVLDDLSQPLKPVAREDLGPGPGVLDDLVDGAAGPGEAGCELCDGGDRLLRAGWLVVDLAVGIVEEQVCCGPGTTETVFAGDGMQRGAHRIAGRDAPPAATMSPA